MPLDDDVAADAGLLDRRLRLGLAVEVLLGAVGKGDGPHPEAVFADHRLRSSLPF